MRNAATMKFRELLFAEHQKLWRRPHVKITVLVLFIYVTLFGGVLLNQWFFYGTPSETESGVIRQHIDGYTAIRQKQDHAKTYGGTLTDAVLQSMVRDYQAAWNDNDPVAKRTRYLLDETTLTSWLQSLFPELRESGYELMTLYVDPAALTELYARRTQTIHGVMEASGFPEAVKTYLLRMNGRVKTPFAYAWTNGWAYFLSDQLSDLSLVLELGIVICLSSAFAGEWHDRTARMLLSMKCGRKEAALAKALSGVLFTTELYLLLAGGYLCIRQIYFGSDGADLPVQLIKMIAVVPMTMRQAEVFELLWLYVSALGFTGVLLFASALSKRTPAVMLFGFFYLILPDLFDRVLPYTVKLMIQLFPCIGNASDIFRMYVLSFGKVTVFLPYAEIASALCFTVLSVLLLRPAWACAGQRE